MRTKGKKQNKLLRGATAPFRALNRIFMNIMFDCAPSFDHASTVMNWGMGSPQVCAQLPRSFSVHSSASPGESLDMEEEEMRQFIRVVSTKLNGSTKQMVVEMKKMEQRRSASTVAPAPGEMRSYSVGVGKIGRIDENEPCEFKELGDHDNLGVYPRTTSCVVTRRTVVF